MLIRMKLKEWNSWELYQTRLKKFTREKHSSLFTTRKKRIYKIATNWRRSCRFQRLRRRQVWLPACRKRRSPWRRRRCRNRSRRDTGTSRCRRVQDWKRNGNYKWTKVSLLKGKNRHSWPPGTNQFRSAAFKNEIIFFYKTKCSKCYFCWISSTNLISK